MDIIDQLKLLEAGKVPPFPREETLRVARETIERLREALQWIADHVDNEDGDLDDIILCANKALAHEQREAPDGIK